jgi:hypothetical protein
MVLCAKNKKRQGKWTDLGAEMPPRYYKITFFSNSPKLSLKDAISRNSPASSFQNTVIQFSNIKNKRSGLTDLLPEIVR